MAATWTATRIVRSHAIHNAILDVPNQRSSHSVPTPRGGGAAIVGVTLLCVAFTGIIGWLAANIATAIFGGGAIVAYVGWLDDRHHVSAGWRAIAHLCAATWAVLWLGGIENVRLSHLGVISGPVASVFAIIAIAWLINLYNFMDGIDGLAAVETIAAGGAGAVILVLGHADGLALISASIAGAGAGFLVWNRMPAQIFMGDVGSGFLGFTFATIALAAHKTAAIPATVWVLLLLVFIGDASITLLRRVFHGDSWYVAHRLHAYQRLVQSGRSHAEVTGYVAVLNVLLAGLGIVVFVQPRLAWPAFVAGLLIVAVAYLTVERRQGMWTVTRQADPEVVPGTEQLK